MIAKGDPANLLEVRFSTGGFWRLVCAVSWAAYSVLLKFWPSRMGPAERLAAIIGGGLLVLLPFKRLKAWLAPTRRWGPRLPRWWCWRPCCPAC